MHTRIAIALAALCAAGAAQTAEAIVVKIPAASMPSTVTLSMAGRNGLPGKALTIPIVLGFSGTIAPWSFRIDVSYDPTQLTFVSAGSTVTASAISTGVVRLNATRTSAMSKGVVGFVTFTLASPFTVSNTPLTLLNCMSASFGAPLSTGCSGGAVAVATCTVSGDATAGVVDVQAMVNQALGIAPAVNDLNVDGKINVADIQMVIGAAMGKGCIL